MAGSSMFATLTRGLCGLLAAGLLWAGPASALPAYVFVGIADWDRDGHQDIIARNGVSDLMLFPGESRRGYSQTQPIKIGNGWNGYTFAGIADWDGDGHQDIVARNAAQDLILFPGQSRRGYSQIEPIKIGNGWNGYTFAGIADWDGDGHQDIIARNAANDLILFPGEGRRGYSQTQPIKIGNGWNGYRFAGIGDWDGDGHPDIIARNAAMDLILFIGEGKRGYSQTQPIKIGNGWNGYSFAGVADWDHDGHQDIVARNAVNDLMLFPGEGKRGYSQTQPIKIGNGW
ncbi:FG-GAP repeat domain-containing protein [Sandarakinorhabdus sp. DWP1-3-1]|uniref:FG-GAP repeat domain-containing protein n=1 Tax=Sandarakinorhabdus sp. DWP1-3-1 TaxID=2804627 RepID=UPI003CF07E3F